MNTAVVATVSVDYLKGSIPKINEDKVSYDDVVKCIRNIDYSPRLKGKADSYRYLTGYFVATHREAVKKLLTDNDYDVAFSYDVSVRNVPKSFKLDRYGDNFSDRYRGTEKITFSSGNFKMLKSALDRVNGVIEDEDSVTFAEYRYPAVYIAAKHQIEFIKQEEIRKKIFGNTIGTSTMQNFKYNGRLITASSKEEAIRKIMASEDDSAVVYDHDDVERWAQQAVDNEYENGGAFDEIHDILNELSHNVASSIISEQGLPDDEETENSVYEVVYNKMCKTVVPTFS